jgi:hypothetical protein
MTKDEIKEKLQIVFRDVFDDEDIVLFDAMTSKDVEDWDSLTHINLINDIEAEFSIIFTTDEIVSAKNVGEFIKMIGEKKI